MAKFRVENRRLDTPTGSTRAGHSSDQVGQAAESLARFFGTGRYLVAQTVFLVIWIGVNVAAGATGIWDKYPFKALNLLFSAQAAYVAPLVLLAQNRQADRDKGELERDRVSRSKSLAETEFLAREIAALKLILASKIDRADIEDPESDIRHAMRRLGELVGVTPDEDEEG